MRKLAILLLCIAVRLGAFGQADTIVSLITAFPGTDIYELEGHSAIRINMGPGNDYAINWGLYDFNAPNFVYRFVKGETDYMAGAIPFPYFLESYARAGRRVEELPLNLTGEQKATLIALIESNLQPENRVYRYNYVKDNCSTRPLRMIELAVGDSINSEWPQTGSFRDVMRSYHRNYPWYQFGIDLALGAGIDYEISPREYAFVPMIMAEQLGQAPFAGKPHALVDIAPDNAVLSPTPWFLTPLFICWLVFAILAVFTVCDNIRGKVTRWLDALYFGILGLAGCLITFLIFISVHEATSPNWLWLWLNPFCLIPTLFIWWKSTRKAVYYYQIANLFVVGIGLISWPFIPQSGNAAFLPLVLATLMRAGSYIKLYKK